MPNWCENYITLTSTNVESIDYIHSVVTSDDDYNLMGLRMPPEDATNGWAVQHWGTKWSLDINSIELSEFFGEYQISISALSAWSPPLELLAYITERFTDVKATIEFHEQGMDFVGYAQCEDGKYYLSDGSISDELPEDFDWDADDAYEIVNDTIDKLIYHHELVVMSQLQMKAGN